MTQSREKNYHSYLRTFCGDFTEMENITAQPDLHYLTNIVETENAYRIQVALPGYKKEQISLKVEEDILSIRAEVDSVRQQSGEKYHRHEIFSSSFEKCILLPEDVNDNKIRASLTDGLLDIELPKGPRPDKTPVNISIR